MLDKLAPANVLVLDSGNALFANAGVATEAEKTRAKFVLGVMEQLGTKVMAVGQRDLSAGLPFLQGLAKTSKLKMLSANLERGGKRVFDASVVIDAGGVKVGLIGLTAVGPVAPDKDVMSTGTVEAARAALKALGPRDLTIVLAATTYADGMQLSTELKNEVDFVIQSGEFRGTQPAQRVDDTSALLFASAQKGQALAKVQVNFGNGKGPFFDLGLSERDRKQAQFVSEQIKTLEERVAAAKDKSAAGELQKTLVEFRKHHKELTAALAKNTAPTARTVQLDWVLLGSDVADDPKIKAEVLKIEPSYAGSH